MDGMTDERLAAIEALAKALTPLSWREARTMRHLQIGGASTGITGPNSENSSFDPIGRRFSLRVQEQILGAAESLPDLIAEVHRLRNEAAKQACIADIYRRKVDELEAEVAQLRSRQPESGNE